MKNNLRALILAAGKGTRMRSNKPKVLHEVSCKPMLAHTIDACLGAGIKNIFVVLGYKKEIIKKILPKGIKIIYQKKQLGTADAIKSARKSFDNFKGKLVSGKKMTPRNGNIGIFLGKLFIIFQYFTLYK